LTAPNGPPGALHASISAYDYFPNYYSRDESLRKYSENWQAKNELKNEAVSKLKQEVLKGELKEERRLYANTFRIYRFVVNPRKAIIQDLKGWGRIFFPEGICSPGLSLLFTWEKGAYLLKDPGKIPGYFSRFQDPDVGQRFFILFFKLPEHHLEISDIGTGGGSDELSRLEIRKIPSLVDILFLGRDGNAPVRTAAAFSRAPGFSFLFLLTEHLRIIFQGFHILGTPEELDSEIGFHGGPVEFTIQGFQFCAGLCKQHKADLVFAQDRRQRLKVLILTVVISSRK